MKAVLDTCIYINYIQERHTHITLNAQSYSILNPAPLEVVVPLAVHAELLRRQKNPKWVNNQNKVLEYIRANALIVAPDEQISEYYAILADFAYAARKKKLNANDLWIAATAFVTKSVLVTHDTDFDVLDGFTDDYARFELVRIAPP